MSPNRLLTRGHSILIVCLLSSCASNAAAAHIPGTCQLGGWAYIDRNNDGHLAFSNEPNPEYAIGDVLVSLFSKAGNVETFVTSRYTDDYGRYLFENIAPGTYVLKQTQPVEYVDGKDTLGILQSWNGLPIPPTASEGVASNNQFSDIVLPADVGGEFYNFGERGLAAGYASKKFLFASPPPPPVPTPEPATLVFALFAAGGIWLTPRRTRRS